jgi:hypothetical protein
MAKVSKAGQRETKETQRNGKSIKIPLMSARAGPFLVGIIDREGRRPVRYATSRFGSTDSSLMESEAGTNMR